MDVKEVVVLDGIEIFASDEATGSALHDMHGPLPEIVVRSSGDGFKDKEALSRETCKLIAISRLRDDLVRFLPGARFLPPTTVDGEAAVGMKVGPKTWLAEREDFLPRIMSCTSRYSIKLRR